MDPIIPSCSGTQVPTKELLGLSQVSSHEGLGEVGVALGEGLEDQSVLLIGALQGGPVQRDPIEEFVDAHAHVSHERDEARGTDQFHDEKVEAGIQPAELIGGVRAGLTGLP
jgi:hypothetical protein